MIEHKIENGYKSIEEKHSLVLRMLDNQVIASKFIWLGSGALLGKCQERRQGSYIMVRSCRQKGLLKYFKQRKIYFERFLMHVLPSLPPFKLFKLRNN